MQVSGGTSRAGGSTVSTVPMSQPRPEFICIYKKKYKFSVFSLIYSHPTVINLFSSAGEEANFFEQFLHFTLATPLRVGDEFDSKTSILLMNDCLVK